MSPATAYKILTAPQWAAWQESGLFAGAPVDIADGFIHLSAADQLAGTAAKHYAGQSDLMLVEVDLTALGETLVWEPSRGGDLFPHLYRRLRRSDLAWIAPLPLGRDGAHRFPELDA